MKIHLVNTFYPPWRGGAETYTRNLAENLSLLGHSITITAAHPPMLPGRDIQPYMTITRLRSVGMFYGVPITPNLINHLLSIEADILHVNFPNPYNAFLGAIACRLKKIPGVLTWHNDLPPVTKLAGALVRVHNELVAPLYLSDYDAIITTSDVYSKDSKILNRFKDRTRIIFNGVDCQRFRSDINTGNLRERLPSGDNKIVLFVGSLTKWHRYKGLDTLFSALKILNRGDVKLLIIGGGDLKPEYESMSKSFEIEDKVVFAGDIPDNQLPQYYAISDMLVVPSKDRSEGFGLTILEANASGVPVIASNVGGIPGILTNGENGVLVPPNDPVSLAAAIEKLIKDDGYRIMLGKRAREVALKHDWKKVAKETEKLYIELLCTTRR